MPKLTIDEIRATSHKQVDAICDAMTRTDGVPEEDYEFGMRVNTYGNDGVPVVLGREFHLSMEYKTPRLRDYGKKLLIRSSGGRVYALFAQTERSLNHAVSQLGVDPKRAAKYVDRGVPLSLDNETMSQFTMRSGLLFDDITESFMALNAPIPASNDGAASAVTPMVDESTKVPEIPAATVESTAPSDEQSTSTETPPES